MSQQNRLIQLPLIGVIVLALLLGLFLAGRKRGPKTGKVVGHKVETPAEDVRKYWTAERMRDAKPVPMPHLTDGEGKQPGKPQKPEKPQA
ncbi:MAG TPA: hypothetical protein VKV40_07010 [Ktedonobacteraceae bacterium]|nr:hypothetical protein [Ktedonobacteraceae bacterium]